MKLPGALHQFLHAPPHQEEVYLSLVLGAQSVQVASWTLPAGEKFRIGESVQEQVEADAWDKRLEACDRAIAEIAQKIGRDDFKDVVLGLPTYYLTNEDDISVDARGPIKTITSELELVPIGFVPIHQAIVHQLKEEEGVPPSVILLEVGREKTTVLVYKVGTIVGREEIRNDDTLVPQLEAVFKGLTALEVLPSRVLLYGSDQAAVQGYKSDLLKHPWPTRANFLHYPKIEILPPLTPAHAVSLAGAGERARLMGGEQPEGETPVPRAEQEEHVAAPEKTRQTDENVVEVTPETLGFARGVDVLETSPPPRVGPEGGLKETFSRYISHLTLPTVHMQKRGFIAALLAFLPLVVISWLAYWVFPKVSMTMLLLPQRITETASVTVSAAATRVDPTQNIIPGRRQEKIMSGEKTIAVSGTKEIGDPARGTVTVYNKTLTSKKLPKGTLLTSGSLSFTLDSDVSIASASESVGSITFGKANAAITAVKVGTESNLPAGTEFSIKDTGTHVLIARNEAALSGGTSRVVTVVSRADQDSLIEALTAELIEKAKAELTRSVSGREQLIGETIKTTVREKSFDAEPGMQAKELRGKITVTVSGISYSEADIAQLFSSLVAPKVPAGYAMRDGKEKITATSTKVHKDGTIALTIEYEGYALPTLDIPSIRAKLAGKSLRDAQEELHAIHGVGGVILGNVSGSFFRQRLPANANNISISTAILE